MTILEASGQQRFGQSNRHRLSRRQFIGGAAAGFIALHSLKTCAADEASLAPPRFLEQWGRRGNAEGEFDACVGIAMGPNDEVYTAEFRNERVQRFTSDGKFLGTFKVQPHAGGLAVDREGTVYVAHWNSNKVAVYSPGGELVREWGAKGTADGEFQ